MPDGDEIDDIDKTSVDDDSQHPEWDQNLVVKQTFLRRFWGIFVLWKG